MSKEILLKFLKKLRYKPNGTFYESLFIYNPKWNEPIPNMDEMFRWVEINGHIQYLLAKNGARKLKILDVGCGRGWLTNLLSKYGEVIGVEPDIKVTQYAKQLFPKITFYPSDFLSFNKCDNNYFDLVVSSEVIEHIEINDRNDFVLKMIDILIPLGYVIITTPRKEIEVEWIMNSGKPDQPIENWFYESELIQLFTSNGFVLTNQSTVKLPFLNISKDVYQTYLFQKSV